MDVVSRVTRGLRLMEVREKHLPHGSGSGVRAGGEMWTDVRANVGTKGGRDPSERDHMDQIEKGMVKTAREDKVKFVLDATHMFQSDYRSDENESQDFITNINISDLQKDPIHNRDVTQRLSIIDLNYFQDLRILSSTKRMR